MKLQQVMEEQECQVEEVFDEAYEAEELAATAQDINISRPEESEKVQVISETVLCTIFIPEDSVQLYKVKEKRARPNVAEAPFETSVSKENPYQQCNEQAEVFVIKASEAKLVKHFAMKTSAATLSNYQEKESPQIFLPVIQRKPGVEMHTERLHNPSVAECTALEHATRVLPDYVMDDSGNLRGLIRKVNNAKLHNAETYTATSVDQTTGVFENAIRLLPETTVDSCGRVRGLVRNIGHSKTINAEKKAAYINEYIELGTTAELSSVDIGSAEEARIMLEYGVATGTNPMFERALAKAVKDCNIEEPFYVKVTPACGEEPDKVVIIPQSVFDSSAPSEVTTGLWTLRNPPGYKPSTSTNYMSRESSISNKAVYKMSSGKVSVLKSEKSKQDCNAKVQAWLPQISVADSSSEFYSTYTDAEPSIPTERSCTETTARGMNNVLKQSMTLPSSSRQPNSFAKLAAFDNRNNHPNFLSVPKQGRYHSNANKTTLGMNDEFSEKLASFKNRASQSSPKAKERCNKPAKSKQDLVNELEFYKYMLCGKECWNDGYRDRLCDTNLQS